MSRTIEEYLTEICSQIRSKELHTDIRTEMSSHLTELQLAKMSKGAGGIS